MSSQDRCSREELRDASGLPDRGELCHQSGTRVPQIDELDSELYQTVVKLIDHQQRALATQELMSVLGCPGNMKNHPRCRWSCLAISTMRSPR